DIGSPIVGRPMSLIIMNRPSLIKFEPRMKSGGVVILNKTLVSPDVSERDDIDLVALDLKAISEDCAGSARLVNMVALGAYVQKSGVVAVESVSVALKDALNPKYHKMIPANQKAIEAGAAAVKA
ncbi:2-oxoacid:acceptor oxidoreductase family protein, partial [bacterium]|nr:2-oxoacid:acceptor oxidoreductase family protein [bacterium]